jgi:hypothetical protein
LPSTINDWPALHEFGSRQQFMQTAMINLESAYHMSISSHSASHI